MADEWYCEIAGREIGPLSSQQLRAMAVKGQILPNDCVRQGVQGSWILARQVKGLLPPSPELPRPKPSVSTAPSPENLPVAEPLPPPPTVPPNVADVFDPASLEIVIDPPAPKAGAQAGARIEPVSIFVSKGTVPFSPTRNLGQSPRIVLPREKRRLERQKMTVGVLLAAVVGLAVIGLLLALGGGSSESGQGRSATPAKNAREAKAASPDVLEEREGIESLDPAKPKPKKASYRPDSERRASNRLASDAGSPPRRSRPTSPTSIMSRRWTRS